MLEHSNLTRKFWTTPPKLPALTVSTSYLTWKQSKIAEYAEVGQDFDALSKAEQLDLFCGPVIAFEDNDVFVESCYTACRTTNLWHLES